LSGEPKTHDFYIHSRNFYRYSRGKCSNWIGKERKNQYRSSSPSRKLNLQVVRRIEKMIVDLIFVVSRKL